MVLGLRRAVDVDAWASFAVTRGRYDTATVVLDNLIKARPNDAVTRRFAAGMLASIGHLRGRLTEAAERQGMMRELAGQLGNRGAVYNAHLDEPYRDLWYRGDLDRGKQAINRLTRTPSFDSPPPGQRNYPRLLTLYALAQDSVRARQMYRAWERIPRSGPPDRVAHHVISRSWQW